MSTTDTILRFIAVINVLFVLLLAFSFLYIDPGSESFVVAVLTLIPIATMLVLVGILSYIDWNPFDF